ncbi:PorP/SprF family type IX secretion system membrane protein [Pedobacter sp. PWIIR3]
MGNLQGLCHAIKDKKMMKKFFLLIFAMYCTCATAQQDSQFTQYIFNGIHINPAYAGNKEDLFLQSFFRSQWVGVKGAPKSFSVAGDLATNSGNVGLGLIAANDQLGAQSNLSVYANYAYRLRLGYNDDSRLSFGIAAGFMQLGLDGNKLSAIDENDESIATTNQNRILPDARFGVLYTDPTFFVGFSATNMLAKYAARNNISNLLVPVPQPHFYFTAGALFPLTEGIDIKPTILIKDDIKGPTSLDINAFVLLSQKVWIGTFYRTAITIYNKDNLQANLTKKSALGGMFELFVSQNFRIGYSYDYSLNALRNYNFGSHEISAGIYINNNRHLKKDRQLRCYDF